MRAVAAMDPLPIADPRSLVDLDLPKPEPTGRDLLVEVKAVSVNPVDVKSRMRGQAGGPPRVLGYDAAGVVAAAGPEATLFKLGDAVYYAGSIDRPGTNQELHLVDERIVGPKPARLGFAAAAALPLTAITAWELLFDRMEVRRPPAGGAPVVLIVGGAGGVGSIAIQLVRQLTELTVIATASRPETQEWCRSLGAHHVIDHAQPMSAAVDALGLGAPAFVLSTNATGQHLPEIANLIAPQGRLGLIDDFGGADVGLLKRKSASIHWEYMFARPVFRTPDMEAQHALLSEVARLIDAGILRTTVTETLSRIDAAHLRQAHAAIETGRTRGKIVLEGF